MAMEHFLLFLIFSLKYCLIVNAYSVAKPGCVDMCGRNEIPYPFGIGDNCFYDKSYEVVCNQNQLFLNSLNAKILDLEFRTISISRNVTVKRVCEDQTIMVADNKLLGSPFSYRSANYVVLVGCGRAMLLNEHNHTTDKDCTNWSADEANPERKYSSHCSIDTENVNGKIYVNYSNSATGNKSSCAYVFLASSEYLYSLTNSVFMDDYPIFSSQERIITIRVPLLIDWAVPVKMLPTGFNYGQHNCFDFKQINNSYMSCSWYCGDCEEGNAFISGGCTVRSKKISRKVLIVLTVGGTSIGIMFLIACAIFTKKKLTKRRERKRQRKFFKRNGGLLLEQLSANVNTVDKVYQFSANDLNKATDHFNTNRILGQGGQGTVFKGMLSDGKTVAIKKSKMENEKQVEHFINEVVILSEIDHTNVVKLLGCCLETEVPLLVYEFVANGTLYDLIHNCDVEFPMPWTVRLRIATEVAAALAHLHSSTSVPVYHRDVKSSNILLDEKYKVKVSDFGTSRHIEYGQTHLTTVVRGTFGYMDPQYFQSSQFTEKSDVYSFAVVLLELLTRQKPISSTQTEEIGELSLIERFLKSMEEDRLTMIVDIEVLESASKEELLTFSKLAQRCLDPIGNKRPTMKEVSRELEGIRISHMSSTIEPTLNGETSHEDDGDLLEMSGEFDTSTFSI